MAHGHNSSGFIYDWYNALCKDYIWKLLFFYISYLNVWFVKVLPLRISPMAQSDFSLFIQNLKNRFIFYFWKKVLLRLISHHQNLCSNHSIFYNLQIGGYTMRFLSPPHSLALDEYLYSLVIHIMIY